MAQWLERDRLVNVAACRAVSNIPLGAGFSEKYHLSPLNIQTLYRPTVLMEVS